MTSLLVASIRELVTNDSSLGDGSPLGIIADAAIAIDDGVVQWVGPGREAPPCDEVLDAGGRAVIPGFVDSHAHLVFAGNRADEFAKRMSGQHYTAGGIQSTVSATRAAVRGDLERGARELADELLRQGATTIEVKSGYGLSVAHEALSVEIAATLTEDVTFLGAHVVAPEFRDDVAGYVSLVTGPMLEACAPAARWIDVFVDGRAFGVEEARAILNSGKQAGLGLRVHANQLEHGPGVALACELGAASADHCTYLTKTDIDALASSEVVATLLPGADFSTRSPYPDARQLVDAGAKVALATDCNPGTSFTTSMPLMIALGVRECHLTPDEALHAATAGGAAALQRSDVGRLSEGARGDLVVLNAPTHHYLAYRPGVPLVDTVVRAGLTVASQGQVVRPKREGRPPSPIDVAR